MNRPRNKALIGVAAMLAVAGAALPGCRGDRSDKRPRQFFPDMDDSPKWKPQIVDPDRVQPRLSVAGLVGIAAGAIFMTSLPWLAAAMPDPFPRIFEFNADFLRTRAWPVVVLYHLYAGVAGLIQFTTVGETFAGFFASISTRYTFPLLTALAAAFVSIFVPSSGGQWAIQGFITARTAEAVGVTAQRGLLALSVGDHVGNLLSPFWVTISAGIARIDFRRFIGFNLVFAALWFGLGVIVFTVMNV